MAHICHTCNNPHKPPKSGASGGLPGQTSSPMQYGHHCSGALAHWRAACNVSCEQTPPWSSHNVDHGCAPPSVSTPWASPSTTNTNVPVVRAYEADRTPAHASALFRRAMRGDTTGWVVVVSMSMFYQPCATHATTPTNPPNCRGFRERKKPPQPALIGGLGGLSQPVQIGVCSVGNQACWHPITAQGNAVCMNRRTSGGQ